MRFEILLLAFGLCYASESMDSMDQYSGYDFELTDDQIERLTKFGTQLYCEHKEQMHKTCEKLGELGVDAAAENRNFTKKLAQFGRKVADQIEEFIAENQDLGWLIEGDHIDQMEKDLEMLEKGPVKKVKKDREENEIEGAEAMVEAAELSGSGPESVESESLESESLGYGESSDSEEKGPRRIKHILEDIAQGCEYMREIPQEYEPECQGPENPVEALRRRFIF